MTSTHPGTSIGSDYGVDLIGRGPAAGATLRVAPVASRPVTAEMGTWIARYASLLGVEQLSEEDVETLLALASTAAHASERTAAPLSCWLAGAAGIPPAEALAVGQRLARELDGEP